MNRTSRRIVGINVRKTSKTNIRRAHKKVNLRERDLRQVIFTLKKNAPREFQRFTNKSKADGAEYLKQLLSTKLTHEYVNFGTRSKFIAKFATVLNIAGGAEVADAFRFANGTIITKTLKLISGRGVKVVGGSEFGDALKLTGGNTLGVVIKAAGGTEAGKALKYGGFNFGLLLSNFRNGKVSEVLKIAGGERLGRAMFLCVGGYSPASGGAEASNVLRVAGGIEFGNLLKGVNCDVFGRELAYNGQGIGWALKFCGAGNLSKVFNIAPGGISSVLYMGCRGDTLGRAIKSVGGENFGTALTKTNEYALGQALKDNFNETVAMIAARKYSKIPDLAKWSPFERKHFMKS